MNELQKEFEKMGYNSWINSDIYPDGKIYTKEYTEWLEKRLVKLLDLPHVSISLPDIYEGGLNTKRILAYTKFSKLYNVSVGTIRDAFCAGADWYKSLLKGNEC